MIRCKFKCESVTVPPNMPADYPGRDVSLSAQWDPQTPEDERFMKATPYGGLNCRIDNPAALEHLKVGAYYYLDLTPVPATT